MAVSSIHLHTEASHLENKEEPESYLKLVASLYCLQVNSQTYREDYHLYCRLNIKNNTSKALLAYTHHHLPQF